ncbi:BTAD domain-containing putative transcriptional regulator [Streptomyces sp. NEAU-S7GS2]|uniref:BTAD domain-containing putative transcriptional regulator n=1 Tax=Streptomyces sp. NEAU-S7GS2 TaxID=2202000 RepID=UPI000D6EDC3D|nr:BTAD domain-containing putative transcriptional regulator [Streptomyces sp. NEAU-S7GS2]AWN31123.1 SARP family transcriptional regulator [Streptomyces sp. NEAU-S7GS2]
MDGGAGGGGAARLRVALLGVFELARGDTELPVPGARLQALVVRLALAGGHAVETSGLIDAIWAEDPPAGPAHALQALVSRLRRALGSAGDVAQFAGGYRLAVDAADVDALRFEQLAAQGRDRLRAGDPQAAAAVLGEAVALWGDRPGAEPTAVAAVAPAVATRLAHASIEAVADLADAELARGRADAAAARLSALLAEHPVHERAAALLMDALAAQGRQADALALYERIRERLADVLGTDPGAALRERHLRLLRAERPAPAPDAAQVRQSNLPAPLTSFIGRDDDLARVDTLLASGRLVTVLGPGGAGKTRLAVEAARRHRHEYRDGVWMIDLASVTEPAKVGAALLATIGLRGSALFDASAKLRGDPVGELDVLADQLDGQESLLVVDNCEHLIDAVAHLIAALLARCAALRVLATSREPLAVDGEALVPLGPLALPEPHEEAGQARRTASVRLFTERAAAVRPGFDVDEHNLAEVLRVVRGLDGMPLALELAAARLRTLSLAGLAAGLSDRFRLLTTGSRTAFPRHRTLRAVIAWSWDLLGADARTVAERIAVLPGGVTPASATAVCAGTAVAAAEVPELLADLVDRSLLQLVPDTGRYRMLETLREYGLERLAEQGPLAAVRDLAARYFAELVARHDPLLRGPGQLDALHVLHAEYDNVLAALRHFCDTDDAVGAIALAVDLSWYWQMLGRHPDAAYWLGETVALPAKRPSVPRDIAEVLLALNTVATRGAPAKDWINERREELRALAGRLLSQPELPGLHGVLTALGLASLTETEVSPTVLQQLVDGPDVWLAGMACFFRAQFAENDGHFDQVRSDVRTALECFARAGDRWGLAKALPLHALVRQYDGDLNGALADLNEAKRLAREFGSLSLSDEIFVDLRRIDLHVRLDEPARAAETIAVARERVLRSASPEMAILLDAREAALRVRTGDLTQARELVESIEAGLSEHVVFGGDQGQALLGVVRSALCLELGDGPGAEEALGRAYAAAVDSRDMPIVATIAVTVAGLAALHGRYREVAVLLGAAARLCGAHDRTDPQIRTLSDRSRAALGNERFAEVYETGWQLDVTAALSRTDPARLRRTSPSASPPEPGGAQTRWA